jgi:hypothetical protein
MKLNAKQVFQMDALGACVTALLAGLVLANHEQIFGLPKQVCLALAFVACGYAVFSFWSSRTLDVAWQTKLRLIAWANLTYIVVTAILVHKYWLKISALGKMYFAGEFIIVLALVVFEWKFARTKG